MGSALGPTAQAWFLVLVSPAFLVFPACAVSSGAVALSWGWLGSPVRNTGLLGTPLPPVAVPSRLTFKQLILGQVGAVSAGAPHTFPAETSLAWAPAGGMTGRCCGGARAPLSRRAGSCASGKPVLLFSLLPCGEPLKAGVWGAWRCRLRVRQQPSNPPHPRHPCKTQLGFPAPAPASARLVHSGTLAEFISLSYSPFHTYSL